MAKNFEKFMKFWPKMAKNRGSDPVMLNRETILGRADLRLRFSSNSRGGD